MKFYKLATLFLLSFGIAFVVSCEEDTSYTKKDESSVIKPQIDFKISSADHLYHRNKTLKKTVDKIKTNMQKSTTSSLYNFGIYESRVQILEKNDYTQYTFEVFRDTILINQLENYVLKVYEDESIEQYLVKFDRQTEYTYDFISIQPIDDPDLNVTKTIGCTPELIDAYEEESCTGIVCTVFGHETGGNGCICGNDNTECPILYYECETTMVFVYDDNCDGGIDGGTTDPEGPPNGGGIDPTTGDPNSTSNDNLIIKPHTIASQEVKDFIETLPQDQQDWLNSLTDCDNTALAQTSNCNQELYGDIISFLNSNIENAQVTTEAQAIVSFIFQNLLIFIGNNNQDLIGSETLWSDDLSNNEEPKWGQLANKQEILNEINNIPNLNNLPFNMQLNSLISHFEKNLMYDRNDQTLELFIQNPQDRVRRYIYSQSGGWIDFHHVFKLFKWARDNGPLNGIIGGEIGELMQSAKQNASAFSYEDLPSNLLGIAMYVRFGSDLENGNITWYDAVETALNEINTVEPEQAPNFEFIPHIVTDGFYPENFNYTPLLGQQLENIHREYFCKRSIQEQINIKEAHEKFSR